ncbi:ATP-dependent DNA helicase [Alkalicella caledoniensis]|uniref:ATP-dependent DNA helicase n=1 Tax=Alkalicella caledoniensis TaxID=2731377 RepID=UPI0031B5817A
MSNREIKISIRNLVEFVGRAGDLDTKAIGSSVRAVEGTRAHQKVQKSYKENYTPEVTLKYNTAYKDFQISLEGRADGILLEGDRIIVDEIKSTTRDLDDVKGDNPLHWGQVKCYGYIYCHVQGLSGVDLQLTYYNIDTGETKKIIQTHSKEELKNFLYDLIGKYSQWVELMSKWQVIRNSSIAAAQFPFQTYRKGQRELAVAVYKTIKDGKKGYFQAPTGIGKTISTLFPTVKAMGEDRVEKIFYLTAKTITRQVAEEAVDKMSHKGLKLKSITLTAKDKICFMDETKCNPDYCPYAKGHFDRVNDAILQILEKESIITRDIIQKYAILHKVCPFEYGLDVAIWADLVICDYNYAFDPRVYLKRFFQDNDKNYVFLVDEAHNLVDRAREMFSAELFKRNFLDVKKSLDKKDKGIIKALNKINSYFLELKNNCGEKENYTQKEEPKELYPMLHGFLTVTEKYLMENEEENSLLLDLFFKVYQFIKISEYYSKNHVTYWEVLGSDMKIKMFCLNPTELLKEAIDRASGTVFFSATLNPTEYYKDLLGGNEDDYILGLSSPFDKNNMKVIVDKTISTYYKDREDNYLKISENLYNFINSKKGNYFAFFPSYAFMNRVYDLFIESYPDIETAIQKVKWESK